MEAIRESCLSSPLPILSTVISSYRTCLRITLQVQELYPCRYPEKAFNGEDLANTEFFLAVGREWETPGARNSGSMTNDKCRSRYSNGEGVAVKRNLGGDASCCGYHEVP